MSAKCSPQKLKQSLMNEMILKSYCVCVEDIPSSWERCGDMIIFRDVYFKSSIWYESDDIAWKFICQLLKAKRIGLKGTVVDDDVRSPRMKIVYGESGWVELKDNGIRYSWDCERSMFCRGNLSERHRIGKLNCQGEVIVDLFAGIGYFTLPYLVHANALHVHACDWNPYAVAALRQNLELNSVADRCTIYEGDNRKAGLHNIGARVNVGIIPSSQNFWKTACSALLSTGGILYIHENVTSGLKVGSKNKCDDCQALKKKMGENGSSAVVYLQGSGGSVEIIPGGQLNWKRPEWFDFSLHLTHSILNLLLEVHDTTFWKVGVTEYFKVKSYAPHIDHLVFHVQCFGE